MHMNTEAHAKPGGRATALAMTLGRARKQAARRFGPAEIAIVVCSVAFVAAVWVLAGQLVQHERTEALAQAVRQNANYALAFEEHTVRTIKTVDRTVQLLRHGYKQHGTGGRLDELLEGVGVHADVFTLLGIVDERGAIVYSTARMPPPMNVADRDYFRFHEHDARDVLLIGKPVTGRLSGKPTIHMTRRIDKADGRFGGLALAAVDAEYFTKFYKRLDMAADGVILLAGLDGIVLARRVGDTHTVGDDLRGSTLLNAVLAEPNGNVYTQGRLDGVKRRASYRRLRDYPLFVAVGASESTLFGAADLRSRGYYWAAALASLLAATFAVSLLAALLRERSAQRALMTSEARFRAMFDQAAVGMACSDLRLRIEHVNARLCEMLGYGEGELVGRTFEQITYPEDVEKSNRYTAAVMQGTAHPLEKRYVRKDGAIVWVIVAATLVREQLGAPDYFVTIIEDITQRKSAESALRESQEQFHQLVEHIPEAFWITDVLAREVIYMSPGYERIYGRPLPPGEDAARVWRETLHPEDRERVLEAFRAMRSAPIDEQYRIVRPDGTHRWVRARGYPVANADGVIYRVAGTVEDITERRALEDRLHHQAHFDSLTHLANRVLFFDRLAQALAQAKRRARMVSILFIDLDRFKLANDTFGHAVGDRLLQQVAQRLQGSVRAEDTVGRLGGDEFAIILPQVDEARDAAVAAEKAMALLAQPFQLDGHEVVVTSSIGIASYPPDGETAEALVKNADTAMLRAKSSGRNTFEFYTPAMKTYAREMLELERDLRRALDREEFLLYFQPKRRFESETLTGCEALLRWRRPDGTIVMPDEFVPLLEDSGLIRPVGEWVIREACAQVRAWRDAGFMPLPIAINLSAKQFQQRDLHAIIDRSLREHGLEPRWLELEITETEAMQHAEDSIALLAALKTLGLTIYIDDFGTGHSSLNYLKRLPVDAVKIDQTFISALPESEHDASIAKAIIVMAHSLGLKVLAEGVEREDQFNFLMAQGCDEMQGHLLSPPVPADLFCRWLTAHPNA